MVKQNLDDKIVDLMLLISRNFKQSDHCATKNINLTLQQIHTLIFIVKRNKTTLSDIASFFAITLPSATVLINKLIVLSLVQKSNDRKDRRVINIKLSVKGKSILEEAMKARSLKAHKLLSYLSLEEKKQLYLIFNSLHKRIKKQNEK